MQKAVVIILICLLSLGLTQPAGYVQFRNLEEQYHQCSKEDHDITVLDFVFEHLLNLEAIVNLLEGEHEYVQGDQPHLPFQVSESSTSFVFMLPVASFFDAGTKKVFFPGKQVYAISRDNACMPGFNADIFRPPILV